MARKETRTQSSNDRRKTQHYPPTFLLRLMEYKVRMEGMEKAEHEPK